MPASGFRRREDARGAAAHPARDGESCGEQVAIETELGRLDIVQGLDGVPVFKELRARATQTEVLGVRVAVCSVEDLKAMKQVAGEPATSPTSRTSMLRGVSSTI